MEHRANDNPRRRDAAGIDRDLGADDLSRTPGGLPAPRTDPDDTGLGDGTDDQARRAVRPPADPAALDDTRDDPLDPPEDRGRYDPDLDRGNRGIGGGRAGGTGP